MNERFGWPSVFYTIGLLSLLWAASMKYFAMELQKQKRQVLGMGASTSLLSSAGAMQNRAGDKVPWLLYLKDKSLW